MEIHIDDDLKWASCYCCSHGAVCRAILAARADPHPAIECTGWTPLHYAVRAGHREADDGYGDTDDGSTPRDCDGKGALAWAEADGGDVVAEVRLV